MKTGVGPGGPRSMAVSYDYISGCVHVACTCTMGILHRPVLAGTGTTVLLIVYWILNSNSSRDTVVQTVLPFLAVTQ